ncbi:MAG TPA: BlaI/MecI/CopY family transcriptional regulator [Cryomorphaceae bacterium]|nr:BlaI/MecI/CopY family transcriptional regulator [Cryomorphaceae bacterium]
MKTLTKAEEQVMQYLWELNGGFVREIIERYPDPKPAYNTVSTIVRILENKEFVLHETFGKSHKYIPAISKEEYRAFTAEKVVEGYFGGSAKNLVSYFIKDKGMDTSDLDEILKIIEAAKSKKKS